MEPKTIPNLYIFKFSHDNKSKFIGKQRWVEILMITLVFSPKQPFYTIMHTTVQIWNGFQLHCDFVRAFIFAIFNFLRYFMSIPVCTILISMAKDSIYSIHLICIHSFTYSEVPNRRADRNKRAGLEKIPPCLLFYQVSY